MTGNRTLPLGGHEGKRGVPTFGLPMCEVRVGSGALVPRPLRARRQSRGDRGWMLAEVPDPVGSAALGGATRCRRARVRDGRASSGPPASAVSTPNTWVSPFGDMEQFERRSGGTPPAPPVVDAIDPNGRSCRDLPARDGAPRPRRGSGYHPGAVAGRASARIPVNPLVQAKHAPRSSAPRRLHQEGQEGGRPRGSDMAEGLPQAAPSRQEAASNMRRVPRRTRSAQPPDVATSRWLGPRACVTTSAR